jgi:hypothetical protein
VPDKQIILVSRSELQAGVQVKMLEAAIKASPPGEKEKYIMIESVNIEFSPPDESDGTTTKLMLSDDEKSYCWSKMKPKAPKFYAEGLLASDRENIGLVEFCSPTAKKEAWIVVDEESDKCIKPSLEYEIELVGNSGQLSGTLVDWVKAVKHSGDRLELLANGSPNVWTSMTISGAIIEKLPGLPVPSPSGNIFPFLKTKESDLRKDLKSLTDAIKAHNETPSSKPAEKEKHLPVIRRSYDEFISSLKGATGRTFASRILKSNAEDFNVFEISEAQRKTIIFELKRITALDIKKLEEKSREWEDETKKPAEEIRKNGVTARSKEFFELLGGSILEHPAKFGLEDFSPTYLTADLDSKGAIKEEAKAVNSFEALLKRSEKSPVSIELQRQEYLKNIKTLTVRTNKRRVLFNAKAINKQ